VRSATVLATPSSFYSNFTIGIGYIVRKGLKSEHKGTYKLAEVTLTTALVGVEGLIKGALGLM
jgi:hypothetical protein